MSTLDMHAALLGPLRFTVGTTDLTPSAPKSRKLLALLLLNANRSTSNSIIGKELWGDNPPRSAMTTIQTYILQLRKIIAEAAGLSQKSVAKTALVTTPNGYQLRMDQNAVDVRQFEDALAVVRQAARREDYVRAVPLLTSALGLWSGPALVDVSAGVVLQAEADALNASQLAARELLIDVELHLGNHHETLSDLTMLTIEWPLNETLHEKLMLALCLSGRRSEAINVFHRLRSALLYQLGREPSVSAHQMLRTMLSSDSTALHLPAVAYGLR
jgi:DNA-binding SARP family transcriptional activator